MTDDLKLTHDNQLQNLYQNIDKSNTLQLSLDIKDLHFDEEWQIIQFICSWAKRHPECEVKLFEQTKIANLDEKNNILLVASYITQKTTLKRIDIKQEILNKFAPYVNRMNGKLSDIDKYPNEGKLTFFCFGGTKNEFSHHFYNNNVNEECGKKIKEESDIRNFIEKSLNILQKQKKLSDKIQHITKCVYEFFSNTDKHGRTSVKHIPIKSSVRALSFRFVRFSKSNRESSLSKSDRYRIFLEKHSQMLIISIFDNGEGIIKRDIELTTNKKEDSLTFDERRGIFSKIFDEGITSSTIPNSGQGLSFAQKSIQDLKGAYLISANGIELFYSPDETGVYGEKYEESHARTGTLVTLLIPVEMKEKG